MAVDPVTPEPGIAPAPAAIAALHAAVPGEQSPHDHARLGWLLFDQAFEPAFTWQQGSERRITAWNAAAERLYGIPRALALDVDPRALLQTRWAQPMSAIDLSLQELGEWRGELVQTTQHGRELVAETVMKLVVLPDGQQIVLETSRDVTAQRQHERATREAHVRLQLALKATRMGIWERDLQTNEGYWSLEVFQVLGVQPSDIEVSIPSFQRLVHPEDRARVQSEVQRVTSTAGTLDMSYRIIRPNGEERWLHNCATVVVDDHGVPQRLVGTVRDITEERQLNARVAASDVYHRQLANALPQILWTCSPSGQVDWLNERWASYTGLREAPPELDVTAAIHPEDLESCLRQAAHALATETTWEAEYRLRGHDGVYRWHLGRKVPIRDEAGRVVRWVATATNIEDRKQVEERLKESDRRKDEFLALLSHELRNPLAPILTAVQLMKLQGEGPSAPEVRVIERQANHMVRLVEDLLDVSRVARGKIDLRMRPRELSAILDKALETTAPLVEQKSHRLTVDVPRAGLMVEADEDRLAQVFANLLTNAARYTPPGGELSVSATLEEDACVVRVRDNGIGISEELLPHVFDMIVQGPRSLDRAEGGLGLGLSLVASLTALHGGTVRAKSDGPGRGSEFAVHLPHKPHASADDERRTPPAASKGPARRILLVDDNEDAAELLGRALRLAGHDVRVCFDPADALAALADFAPELAILDIGLPVMSGFQLAREIRARLDSPIHLFALSGYAQPQDRVQAQQAGFSRHFVKPASISDVLAEIVAVYAPEAAR